MNTVTTIPVGTPITATEDVRYIEGERVVSAGTLGTVTYYYSIFKAYQVKFVGFAREMLVARSQIELA